jgi:heme-degrading monooxygenase HmoA
MPIIRIWRGVVPEAKADEYLRYLEETGLNDYRKTPGNRGVRVLRRTTEGRVEFLLQTEWESIDAVRRFAGDDVDRAVYYPKDREFLLELEPNVAHYEVAFER